MCQYIQRSPDIWSPRSSASASPPVAGSEERVERGVEVVVLEEPALHGGDLLRCPSMSSRISRATAA